MRRKVKVVVEELSDGFEAKVSGGLRRSMKFADSQVERLMEKVSKAIVEMMK